MPLLHILHKKNHSKAFTLIEILIYTAIFGVVAAGIIGVAWNITRLHTTQIASNEIDENLRYVMNLVNSKVREATMIEQASGTTLILRMPDSTKSPTTFSLSNGTLYIQEGSTDPVAITSNRVEVTSLNFEYISVAGSKGGVRISITMAYKEQPGIASREYLTTVTKVNAITFDSDILPDVTNLRNVGVESLRWKNGYFSGNVNVAGDVTASGYITGTTGLCMGTDCRTSWGQVTGVTGSGTQNYIAKWTSSGSIGNSQIFDNGTNVGIGTTSPGAKLDVAGILKVSHDVILARSDADPAIFTPSGSNRGIRYITRGSGSHQFQVDDATKVIITSGGSLGIGTASPPSLLSVGASSQFQVNSSGDIVKIKNLTYSWPSSHAVGFLKNDGSGNLTWDTSGAVGGTGSAGQVAFWSATTTITGDSGFYWDNTNKRLGIGTTAPGQKLSVVGDIGLSGGERFIGTTDAYGLSIRTNNTNRIFISADGNVGIGTTSPSRALDVHGIAQLRGAAGGTGLFVDSGGNVGIGTTAPRVRLDAEAGAIRAQMIQWDFDDKTLAAALDADASSSGNVYILTQAGNNFMIYTRNAANTANIERLRIQNKVDIANFSINNSNVGIGTTSPSVKLHVYESDAAKSGALINIATTSSSYYSLNVQSGGTSHLYVRADGNVGIGTTSPGAKLSVSGGVGIGSSYAGTSVSDGNLIVSGNVGIGTTSPGFKLDVNGSARVTNVLRAGNWRHVLSSYFTTTPTNGILLTTAIPYDGVTNRGMHSIRVVGYAYGESKPIDFEVVFYLYTSGFVNYGWTNYGAHDPGTIKLSYEGNVIKLWWSAKPYFASYEIFTKSHGGLDQNDSWFEGWTLSDASAPTTNTVDVPYRNAMPYGLTMRGNISLNGNWLSGDGDNEGVYVSNTGNVGIGTTNPSYKLDVSGDIRATGTIYGTFSGTINAANVSAGSFGANTGGGNYSFPANLTIVGNVGIGTTSPDTKLQVAGDGSGFIRIGGGTGCGGNYAGISLNGNAFSGCSNYNFLSSPTDLTLYINRPSGQSIKIRENNSDQMIIAAGGNVGIGTTNPSYKLEVAGGPIKAGGGLIIETRTSDPSSPITGQIWLRTDI